MMYYFWYTLFLASLLVVSILIVNPSLVNGISMSKPMSPRWQMAHGVLPENVSCPSSLVLIKKLSVNSVACVWPQTAQKLVERGWGKIIQEKSAQTDTKTQLQSLTSPTSQNGTNQTGKLPKPLAFELWPSLFSTELPVMKNKLISGDVVFLQTTDPTSVAQYKNGYFASGVKIYAVYRSYGVADIEAKSSTLPTGYDVFIEDYETGPTYEPAFTTNEIASVDIFHRCLEAVAKYNQRTDSQAQLWITPSYKQVNGENWNWSPVRHATDILQVQTQPWQESDPQRSLLAAQHVDATGGHDWIAQTSISGAHTVSGAVALARNLATVPSVTAVMVFTASNATGLQQLLNLIR